MNRRRAPNGSILTSNMLARPVGQAGIEIGALLRHKETIRFFSAASFIERVILQSVRDYEIVRDF
jgi:hypothetical protein